MMSFANVFPAPIDTAIWTNSSPIAGGDPLQHQVEQMNFHSATAPLHQPSGDASALSTPLLYYSSSYPSYDYTDYPTPYPGQSLYSSSTYDSFAAPIDNSLWDVLPTAVQPKEEILREIMAECEEIERRSLSPSSSTAAPSPLPSSTYDSDSSTRSSPGPILSSSSTTRPCRKERKKMQNRVAATRYREKKRKEKEETKGVMEELQKRNKELREKANEIEMEVNYLKKLFKEIGVEDSRLSTSQ